MLISCYVVVRTTNRVKNTKLSVDKTEPLTKPTWTQASAGRMGQLGILKFSMPNVLCGAINSAKML